jgi:hypothetical protein
MLWAVGYLVHSIVLLELYIWGRKHVGEKPICGEMIWIVFIWPIVIVLAVIILSWEKFGRKDDG